MVRFKQRYLQLHVTRAGGCADVSAQDMQNALRRALASTLGYVGFGALRASLAVKYWNPDTGSLIVRVARGQLRQGWFGLCAINELKGARVALCCQHVGGTLRVVKTKLLRAQLERQRAAHASK